MRYHNVLVRAVSAVLVTILLNGSLIAAFAHAASGHGARVPYDTRLLA